MINDKNLKQESGNGATNFQAGGNIVIVNGLSYEDVQKIALEVYKRNFYELVGEAREVASQRAEEVTERIFKKFSEENPEAFRLASDPDFLASIYEIQKSCALSKDRNLEDVLIDLLVDRSRFTQRDRIQLTLDEAIKTAPKIIEQDFSALSIVFLLRNRGINGKNFDELGQYFDQYLYPFLETMPHRDIAYRHLEYARCGSLSIGEISFQNILLQRCRGLFFKGFDEKILIENKINKGLCASLWTSCLNDSSKLQINALNLEVLKARLNDLNIDDETKKKIETLFNQHHMSELEIKVKCISIRPYIEKLFNLWEASGAKHFELTSVGMALAHANIRKTIGKIEDLSLWIR